MLVSIIMPCFNSASFIGVAIESVIEQTFKEWELIVVDDRSTDNSVDVVRSYQVSDSRIKLLILPENRGAAGARNAAISVSQGRYIAFLDSDDWWRPEKLATQLEALKTGNAHMCFSSYEKIHQDDRGHRLITVPAVVSFKDLLKFNPIGCSTAIYDTVRCGGKLLMPNIRKRQDYGLWLRILKNGGCAIGLQAPLAFYRVRRNSVSSNKISAALYHWRVLRGEGGVSVVRAAYYFCFYAVHGLKAY
ncbi:glycosyltransferase involved in cell wall biosynthesis [Hydrogenophaga palleronii]|uniref:Glycosyltransferase involved in cell wall biosynthesis n=1 Tax=Hydrogenophaga palleronii TaxID=65655 RepID=A0ABU1WSS0_9BURK|nr:glycosyltransferase family 2 protein [Hydrogenophaga palleronii]MDR7152340.1 glycosyltransferase involved in cell wall biosynthesis [Hydrogenophaga palleronii]